MRTKHASQLRLALEREDGMDNNDLPDPQGAPHPIVAYVAKLEAINAELLGVAKLALAQAEGEFICLRGEDDGTCARRCIRELTATLRAAIANAEGR